MHRYGAREPLAYEDSSAETLADAIVDAIDAQPSYRPINPRGASNAAALIAELL